MRFEAEAMGAETWFVGKVVDSKAPLLILRESLCETFEGIAVVLEDLGGDFLFLRLSEMHLVFHALNLTSSARYKGAI